MFGGLAGVATAQITGDAVATSRGELVIHPIDHATFVMGWNGKAIYVDPVGGGDRFAGLPAPDLILVTDIHGDHMNAETLSAIVTPQTRIVAPAAVADQLPASLMGQTTRLANGEDRMFDGVGVEGVPMYNLTPQAASGVNAFDPEIVYPYHYGDSDVEKFKALVEAGGGNTEVRIRDWYATR